MKLTMTPAEYERYRRAKINFYNVSQKFCNGCKRRRSAGQFDEGKDLCKRCVLRAGK